MRRALRSPEQRLAAVVALEKLIRRGSLETEPAVITLLAEERIRAERLASAAGTLPASLKALKSLQRKLYPYQREGVRRFFEAGRLLLADDMGLGKTTQAIAACHGLLETRRIQRALLIVPASLKRQWKREWDATTHLPLQLVEGSPEERKKQYASARRGALIVGYEQLLRDFQHIARFAPELVVLDEAQRIKNWATKSAAYVKALAPEYRLVLTGTPLENRYDELFARQRMICNGLAQVQFEQEWPRCQTQAATPSILESLFAPKLATLRGLVEQVVLGQRRKAVVLSQWRNMLRLSEWAVRDQLASAGLRAVFFTGAESSALRERGIVEFHDDPRVAMMFLSDAGGIGLNLQRAANCCINLELPWNPAVLEQRIGRIYRLGQTSPIDVYNLVSEEGIEARIATLVEHKRAVFSGLFDGTTDTVMFEGQASFLEGMKKLVDPVPVPLPAAEDVDAVAEPAVASGEPAPASAVEPAGAPLGQLAIERLADGSLRIAAPPELAAPIAALLEQLARGLRASDSSSAVL